MRIAFYSNRNSSVTVIGYSCRNSFFLAGGRKTFFTGELSAFCVEFDTVDFAIIHNDFIIISRNPNIVAASIISALVKPCFCVVIQDGGFKAVFIGSMIALQLVCILERCFSFCNVPFFKLFFFTAFQ